MNKLKEIADLGLNVTWQVIAIGLFGKEYIVKQLSREEMFEYLDDQLNVETKETNKIIQLICEKENDWKADKLLLSFVETEKADVTLQLRKWRVYLLKKTLNHISPDCLRGLLELNEFWASVGFPDDSPHIIPGNPPSLTIQEYYTQDMFDYLLKRNNLWAVKEINDIKILEKSQ